MTIEIIKALTKAQLEIEAPEKDKMGAHSHRYASLDSIYKAVRQPLAKQGITITHSVDKNELITTLYHISGETISNRVPFVPERAGTQGIGATLTYMRRYAVCALIALPTEDDTDGEEPKEKPKVAPIPSDVISDKQLVWLEDLANKNIPAKNHIFKTLNITTFIGASIPKKEFEPLRLALATK